MASVLGAEECEAGDTVDVDEPLCGMCRGQDGVFGVEDDVKELVGISRQSVELAAFAASFPELFKICSASSGAELESTLEVPLLF